MESMELYKGDPLHISPSRTKINNKAIKESENGRHKKALE